MINKRLGVDVCMSTSVTGTFQLFGYKWHLYLHCMNMLNEKSYEWIVHVCESRPSYLSAWKNFPTCAEAERWIREHGYL